MKEITKEQREKYYRYLEALRDMGTTNMWGAGPYLHQAYPEELSATEARHIHLEWIESFKENNMEHCV